MNLKDAEMNASHLGSSGGYEGSQGKRSSSLAANSFAPSHPQQQQQQQQSSGGGNNMMIGHQSQQDSHYHPFLNHHQHHQHQQIKQQQQQQQQMSNSSEPSSPVNGGINTTAATKLSRNSNSSLSPKSQEQLADSDSEANNVDSDQNSQPPTGERLFISFFLFPFIKRIY